MIPKKIHYCWFGGSNLDDMAIKCIESWKHYCPDYEIVEWNETNFSFDDCQYAKCAYDNKKWAFVSDYARFKILYENGGVYFDTDVELIKPIDELLLNGAFMGVEDDSFSIASGLGVASPAGLQIFKEIIDNYKDSSFYNNDGSISYKTVVTRVTEIFKNNGYDPVNACQRVSGVTIYPKEYFCPLDYSTGYLNITDNTVSIHHYGASWLTESEKRQIKVQQFLRRKFRHTGNSLAILYVRPFQVVKKTREVGLFKTIKSIFNRGRK